MKGWRRKREVRGRRKQTVFNNGRRNPEPICSEVGGKNGKGNVVEERGTRGNQPEGTRRGEKKARKQANKGKGGKTASSSRFPPDVDPLGEGDCPLLPPPPLLWSLSSAAAPGTFPAAENMGR